MAAEMAVHGRQTMVQRHTCAPRVDELLRIWAERKSMRSAVKTETRLCDALTAAR